MRLVYYTNSVLVTLNRPEDKFSALLWNIQNFHDISRILSTKKLINNRGPNFLHSDYDVKS